VEAGAGRAIITLLGIRNRNVPLAINDVAANIKPLLWAEFCRTAPLYGRSPDLDASRAGLQRKPGRQIGHHMPRVAGRAEPQKAPGDDRDVVLALW